MCTGNIDVSDIKLTIVRKNLLACQRTCPVSRPEQVPLNKQSMRHYILQVINFDFDLRVNLIFCHEPVQA